MTETNNVPENPYRSTDFDHGTAGTSLITKVVRTGLLLGVLLLILVPLLWPASRGVPEAGRRATCLNNTKNIALALMSYQSKHGEFPPAYTVDDEGNRLHSWRTLILPYVEGNHIYERVDFTKPWNDEANADARQSAMELYLCPSWPGEQLNLTSYVAIVGPECVFTGSTPTKMDEIVDSTSNTLLIVEVGDRHIEWMEPEDITLEEFLDLDEETKTNHPHGIVVGYIDGRVDFMEVDINKETLRAMATKAGREIIGEK